MGLIDRIFGKKEKLKAVTEELHMMSSDGEHFLSWDGTIYKSDIVRAAIRPTVRAIGKMTPTHIKNKSSNEFEQFPDHRIKKLMREPNPLMTHQDLLEKMAWQLELNKNAFAYIIRDEQDRPFEIWPLNFGSCEIVESASGNMYLRCFFKNGKIAVIPYRNVIHIRDDFNEGDFFGDSPQEALRPLMEVISTSDQGLVKAIKNSATVRWIMKFRNVLKDEDVDNAIKRFSENYLKVDKDNMGVATSDPRYDADQVKPYNYVPEAEQNKSMIERVYAFFNTNEKIVKNTYTEDEWTSYFEGKLAAVSMKLSNAYTRNLFTERQKALGDEIIFQSENLLYSSFKTKLGMVALVDRGAMIPNDWAKLFGLPPQEGGDKAIRRLDTAEVGSQKHNEKVINEPNSKGGDDHAGKESGTVRTKEPTSE